MTTRYETIAFKQGASMEEALLMCLAEKEKAQRAPDQITFAAYPEGKLSTPSGADHLVWDIGIGKDHTAQIIMHKDAWEELKKRVL